MARVVGADLSRHLVGLFGHGTAVGLGEAQLIGRFVEENDSSAFEAIVERHGPMVWGVCRRWLRDPNDAEDAFQATFLILARRAGSIGRPERLGGWLHGVANKVAVRASREAARRPTAEAIAIADEGRGDTLEERERAELLHQEIERLPTRYRDPIVLCHLEGCTHDEAAARLGWPVGTVRGRLSRGRDRLRDRLSARGMASAAFPAIARAPLPLIDGTVRAATAFAVGRGATSLISAQAASWTQGALKTMIITKIRTIALAAGLVIATGTFLSQSLKAQRLATSKLPGSSSKTAANKEYIDGKYGFSMTVPGPWTEAPLGGYGVPGVLRAAWSVPAGASITAFVQESGAVLPRFLVDDLARPIKQNLKGTIQVKDVRTVGGKKAAWMVATGKGNGGTIGVDGGVETTTHWVAVPREKDIVVVLLTCPAADYERNLASFEETIGSMKVEGTQTAAQSLGEKPGDGRSAEIAVSGTDTAGRLRLVESFDRSDLAGANSLTMSGDGRALYATGYKAYNIVAFARDPASGKLNHLDTYEDGQKLCMVVGFRLSPDGRRAAAAAVSSGAVVLYKVDAASGRLRATDSAVHGTDGAGTLAAPTEVVFSNDSRFLYAIDGSGSSGNGAVAVFEVDGDELKFVESFEGEGKSLAGCRGIAMHPDGKKVLVVSTFASTLVVLDRDEKTGRLADRQVVKNDEGGVHGLGGATRVICSPDGRFVYSVSGRFKGNPSVVGAYRFDEKGQSLRLLQELSAEAGEIEDFAGGNYLALSPDGRRLYATGTRSGSLACLDRDTETGRLTFAETFKDGAAPGQLRGAAGVAVSPDGQFVYVSSEFDRAVNVFRREPKP